MAATGESIIQVEVHPKAKEGVAGSNVAQDSNTQSTSPTSGESLNSQAAKSTIPKQEDYLSLMPQPSAEADTQEPKSSAHSSKGLAEFPQYEDATFTQPQNPSHRPPQPIPRNTVRQSKSSLASPEPQIEAPQPPILPIGHGLRRQPQVQKQRHRPDGYTEVYSSPNGEGGEVTPLMTGCPNRVYTPLQPTNTDDEIYILPNDCVDARRPNENPGIPRTHRPNENPGTPHNNNQNRRRRQPAPAQGNDTVVNYAHLEDTQQNRKFSMNMKRYIFTCLGMPGIPGIPQRLQWLNRMLTVFGVLGYIVVFVWGIINIVLSVNGIVGVKSEEDEDDRIVFVATILCDLCFILLGFYWMIVYWWSQVAKSRSRKITFSILTTLWLVLSLYLVGTTSSLGTAIYFRREVFVSGFHYGPNNFYKIPLLSLSSIVVIWVVYVIIFAINVIFSYCSSRT